MDLAKWIFMIPWYTVEQKKAKYILVLIICLSDAKMVYL